jgi:hypothetical protein
MDPVHPRMKGRLAAILATDGVKSSSLLANDQLGGYDRFVHGASSRNSF